MPGCARVWGVPPQLSGLLTGMLPSLFIDKSQMRMRNGEILFFWMGGVVMETLGRKVSD